MNKVTFEDKVAISELESVDNKNKVTADDMNQIKAAINSLIEEGIANIIKEENQKRYYVGSLIFDTKNVNPATYLGFGTWQLWGQGCVPVGVDTTQTEFATVEKTGGSKGVTLTTNNLPEHNHSIVTHTHSLPSHNHSTPNHSHTFSGTTSGTGRNASLVANVGSPYSADPSSGLYKGLGWWDAYEHTHTYSGTTSSNNGGNTGSWSGTSGEGGPTETGNTGSGSSVSVLQPYVTCYIWKRTA